MAVRSQRQFAMEIAILYYIISMVSLDKYTHNQYLLQSRGPYQETTEYRGSSCYRASVIVGQSCVDHGRYRWARESDPLCRN